MERKIYLSVTGRNEGGKLVPFLGEVRVGHESVTVFGEAAGLEDKLRAALVAIHLANALGIAEFDIPAILEDCAYDKSSAEAMMRPFEGYCPADDERIKTAHAFFTSIRSTGNRRHLLRDVSKTDRPCDEDEASRSGRRIAETIRSRLRSCTRCSLPLMTRNANSASRMVPSVSYERSPGQRMR